MKRKLSIILILSTMVLLSACQTVLKEEKSEPGEYHKITAREAQNMMEEEDVIIVDVRTKEEYEGGRIKGSILIPNESIENKAPEELPDQDAKILIYCRSGRRSKEAAEKLMKLGYKNIYDFGGIHDWPYDIVTS